MSRLRCELIIKSAFAINVSFIVFDAYNTPATHLPGLPDASSRRLIAHIPLRKASLSPLIPLTTHPSQQLKSNESIRKAVCIQDSKCANPSSNERVISCVCFVRAFMYVSMIKGRHN